MINAPTETSRTKGNEMKTFSTLALLSITTIFLSSCGVTTSGVTPAGKDTYFISGRGYAVTSDNAFPALYKEADTFCKNQGKAFSPFSSHAERVDQMSSSVNLTFRCLLENDPEYKRPEMKQVPNTSIEVINK